jgi:hypothetical protein
LRPGRSVGAIAVFYMIPTLIWPLIALQFVDPTHILTWAERGEQFPRPVR